jgi:DNA-binding MarR family transcriptional regulator
MRKHLMQLHSWSTPWYTREVTRPIDDDELASEWHDLMGRYHRITCALDRSLTAEHGLTVSEFEVLQELYSAGPQCQQLRMSELGERVHLSQSAFSRLISRLEQSGLVERAACNEDRRSALTRITQAGIQRYLEARPTQRAVLHELAREKSADRADDVAAARAG